ncbi:taurine catabolism dioxygenase [Hyaloscypha variabilis]
MPSAVSSTPPPSIRGGHEKARPRTTEPLAYSGSPDADTLIRDLAITGRGVVFLRNQDANIKELLAFGKKLSKLAGSVRLHINPIIEAGSELGDQISAAPIIDPLTEPSKFASSAWHANMMFKPVPSDYALLKIYTLPLTRAPWLPLRDGVRGSELNQGKVLQARHPVIRTNPVTGWKSVFVNKAFTKRIVELTKDESDVILAYLFSLVSQNHDNQVRFKWRKNDVAIWDNRSNWHTATFDYTEDRIGDRVVALGEAPYFDPASISRKAALAKRELPIHPTQ